MLSANSAATQAQVVIPTRSLQEDIPFFSGVMGMRMESIFPAEDPSVAVFAGHGVRFRIERTEDVPADPAKILLFCDHPSQFNQR